MGTGMAHGSYIIRGGLPGSERLRVLARVMRPVTLPLLDRLDLRPGLRRLDVGCGGGGVTIDPAGSSPGCATCSYLAA